MKEDCQKCVRITPIKMPGCAAVGCNNRSEKGYTMKCFPRDPHLRNIWKQRVGRADWEPSNNSFLCHVHFEANQWVVTSSGRVKLKKGAIPSIFTVTSTRKSAKKRVKSGSQESMEEDCEEEYEVEYLESDPPLIMNMSNQSIMPNIIVQTQNAVVGTPLPSGQLLQNIQFVNSDALKDLRNENIIIVADENNREIGKIINDSSIILLDNDVGKENVQILPKPEKSNNSSRVKIEVKEEIVENGLSNDTYDEIERKLEEICHSENETDSSNNFQNNSKIHSQSIDSASTFSLEDLENGVDSVNESSNHEPEPEVIITGAGRKRKRSRTESINGESTVKTSQITNNIHHAKLPGNLSKIIQKLVVEKPTEPRNVQKNSVSISPIKNSQPNKSNKPIIKNDIQLEFRSEILNRPVQIKKNNVVSVSNPKPSNEILNKLDVQGEVIQKLSEQLIMYKDMDRKMQQLTQELQNKNKEIEMLNRKPVSKKPAVEKKNSKNDNTHASESNDVDLRSRFDSLEEKHKKLMKTVTLEAQNRRKLECQIKSRDNQIKELNWKLEKASKFLERAEKNANNYRKKMLNMQALVRRKKLANEKSGKFDELLVGQVNQNYSENAVKMAMEIEKFCGQDAYQKLREYEFPLPNMRNLHNNSDGSVQEIDEVILGSKDSDNDEQIPTAKVKVEKKEIAEINDHSEGDNIEEDGIEVEYLSTEFLNDNSETVSGTVQDIFNEQSDNEEMDLNELRKHIMIDFNEET